MDSLIVERSDGVVTLTLNRPKRKNAIDGPMWAGLRDIFDEVARTPEDRVLVVTGAGDAFCSGADLGDAAIGGAIADGAGTALARMRTVGAAALALHHLPKPTVASVNGVAAGAGMNLALGCDLVVASEEARFSEIFPRRGLVVDFGGTWLLPRLVGLHRAKELALLGEIITAKEAADIGLVNRIVPAGDLRSVTDDLARRLASAAPLPASLVKMALNQSYRLSMAEALEYEAVAQNLMFTTNDAAEAVRAFLEKREPRFSGR